ncbi:hypothetical protein F1F76_08605 [Listeria monocytogenes]|nr:hypothetical protein [Listeria monocytogenes]EAF4132454.1 hypothetical protein [Listeria monocytogenes]EAF4935368.1 hypothetical protein [Listeria monocytogenes]ECR2392758.1 hypothetical protein [Listeria monocytogenes]ECR2512826.1 hypothetical protein [Listeria monocytogenes]
MNIIRKGDRVQTVTDTECNRADLQGCAKIPKGTFLYVDTILNHKLLIVSRPDDDERRYMLNVSKIAVVKYEWEEAE